MKLKLFMLFVALFMNSIAISAPKGVHYLVDPKEFPLCYPKEGTVGRLYIIKMEELFYATLVFTEESTNKEIEKEFRVLAFVNEDVILSPVEGSSYQLTVSLNLEDYD